MNNEVAVVILRVCKYNISGKDILLRFREEETTWVIQVLLRL